MSDYDSTSDFQDDEIPVTTFRKREFARRNQKLVDEYVEHRLRGMHSIDAFRMVFGEFFHNDMENLPRANQLEANPYYIERYQTRFAEVKVSQLWDDKKSIIALLNIANDPFAKHSTRLAAVREINVLTGITLIDESGRTMVSGAGEALKRLQDAYEKAGAMALPPIPDGVDTDGMPIANSGTVH